LPAARLRPPQRYVTALRQEDDAPVAGSAEHASGIAGNVDTTVKRDDLRSAFGVP